MYDVGKIKHIIIPFIGIIEGRYISGLETGIPEVVGQTYNADSTSRIDVEISFKIVLKNGTIIEGVSNKEHLVQVTFEQTENIIISRLM